MQKLNYTPAQEKEINEWREVNGGFEPDYAGIVTHLMEVGLWDGAPLTPYVLKRDGQEIERFSFESDMLRRLHRIQGQSAHHACKYEGYSMEGPNGPIVY